MKKITLLTFLSVFTTLIYAQNPAPPSVDSDQYFCSQSAWLLINETADNLGDLQVFPDVVGWTITWYEDNPGSPGTPGAVITNPNNEVLVAGTVYHVTQTDTSNNESAPLAITVNERDCGCIKDPSFEDQNGNERGRGYTYTQFGIVNHKTCGQGPMLNAPAKALGTKDAMTSGNEAVFVTAGIDPTANIPITKTNPDNPASSHGFRLNRNGTGPATVTSMQKYFIASEVFVFSFATVLQNPTGHTLEEMPFSQVNLYDINNNLVTSRCLISDPNDCIFIPVGSPTNLILYNTWSCMKLNTFEYQGQPLRAEFYSADCTLSGHYGYLYIDDIYVGEDDDNLCGNPSFGYALLESVEPAGRNCFISEPAQVIAGCVSGLAANIPGFPLEVCGLYSTPISQSTPPTLDQISLNIIQNNIVVGTVTNPTQGSGAETFCFIVTETDINVLPYGDFTFEVVIDFELDCGDPYQFLLNDSNSFTLCPTAGCPAPLTVCDVSGTGFGNFDLTDANESIRGIWNANDVDISYFENEQDAHDDVNEIPDPTDYNNTTANQQTVYARLDWNVPGVTCYYLVEVDLMIQEIPDLVWDQDILVCGNTPTTLVATPTNLSDLGTVTYRWFKDGNQLPHAGSAYDATESGVYTVIVSNMGCEITRSVTVDKIDFTVDLGPDVSLCDTGGNYTLSPTVTPEPGTTFDINDATYLWSTGETTATITATTAGLYWVEVTYEGCTEIDQVMMDIAVQPIVTLGADIVKCKDETVVVQAMVTNMDSSNLDFVWYDSANNQVGSGSTLPVTEIFGGEEDYTVRVYDPLTPTCFGEDTINVKYFSNENCTITQGLSPDGSPGFNDNLDLAFLAERTGIENLQIFNRFGVIVYEFANYTDQWVGQSKSGDLLPTGLYYYVINLSGNDPVFGNQTNGYIYINRAAN